jgi:protein TonB
MTGGPMHRMEVAGARAEGDAGDLSRVTPLAARSDAASSAPPITATNVIPFVRTRREPPASGPASDFKFDPAARPAPYLIGRERRVQIVALLALSLAAHYGLYVLFNREPEPLASIGLEAISVEIMLGDNRRAGVASTPGQQHVDQAPADDPNPNPLDPDTTTAKVEETPPTEVKAAEQSRRLAQTTASEVAPERPRAQATEAPPERPEQKQEVAVLRSEETPVPREPELSAAPEEPVRVTPTKPDRPEPVKTETRPQPQPKAAPKQEAKKKQHMRPKERPGPPTRTVSTQPNPTGPHASAASGAGPGRSQLNSNYPGIVFAHLARQRSIAETRVRGEQGNAVVSFGLDGGGRVTRVSLTRGTGSATLDQEAIAMVRRASPFPAPPDGRPQSFNAPISFRIQ